MPTRLALALGVAFATLSQNTLTYAQSASVGQAGAVIQMLPLMLPIEDDKAGIVYMPVSLRVTLASGEFERKACFAIPLLHEALLFYLHSVRLTSSDLTPLRKETTEKLLTSVARLSTDSRLYARVEIVDRLSLPLDPRSQAMTNQCR